MEINNIRPSSKGGNNIFILYVSDSQHYISRLIDHYIYFDAFAVEKNSPTYSFGERYFVDKKIFKNQNSYAIGLAAKLLGIDMGTVEEAFLKKIPEVARELNRGFLEHGYASQATHYLELKPISEPKLFWYGNQAIANGAMDSGLGFYSAYPMTPASSLIDVISHDPRVVFFQGEDEISVAMSMLGAKFAGKRSMCGTSGG